MTQTNRTQSGGSRINRDKKISFSFDGKTYSGFEGDTLASALLANGVKLMGRSFKYHRPRGCLTSGSEEPNAIVELGTGAYREPNTRATMIEIYDGLEAKSQNRFPSLAFDIQSINQLFSPFLTAGFYYKTFMWPASFWEPIYEKIIRRSAGLGRAATQSDPDHYEHAHAHCDVLVVGAGVTGISAARSAAATGARVTLVEEQADVGGMSSHRDIIDGIPADDWCKKSIAELVLMDNVTFMSRTVLFGYYDHNLMAALERVTDHIETPSAHLPRQRLWTIRAKEVVIACGSQERPMIFDNNDRPGIMLSSSVRSFVDNFGVLPGKQLVIATNNDSGYETAEAALDAGAVVSVVVDARSSHSAAAEKIIKKGVRVLTSALPQKAHGRLSVNALSIQSLRGNFLEKVGCDCVAVSGGFSADVHLASQTGAIPKWRSDIQSFVPSTPLRAERSAGAGNGAFGLFNCLNEGHKAGADAAKSAGLKAKKIAAPKTDKISKYTIDELRRCPGNGKAFVDFQNDVTAQDITLAAQEGFISVEHTKRYTTLGMATDQGKTSNVNGLAILAEARGVPIEKVGTTRFRPPYSPVAIGAFAGHERGKEFQPIRRTAMHECAVKLGAVFIETGQWLRPQYYPKPGEGVMEAIYRESKQVRETAGICDVSSLGKIDIFGDDAGEFLNRLYINGWKMLAPGKARYGLMLREDGYVFDDGTTSRLADDHYFMTTTTANAARVLAHMEHASQVLWPDLDVYFCSATEQWCGVAVAGPNARKILADAFGDGINITNEAVPFMGVCTFDWLGTKARVFRISFSGELAFEINVPWSSGENMWNTIWEAGQKHGLIAYGSEALGVMRIEKGHVAGNELDGRTTAADMGLGKMMSTKKAFIGQKMAGREGMISDDRATLVGVKIKDTNARLRGGAHLVVDKNNSNSETDLGWVTSVADSPAVGCWIGLAYLKGGLEEHEGQQLYAVSPLYDEAVMIEICSPHFFDQKGERLHV
ncbi:sarcosine oxidase subunit alpha family protein [Lentilitoribacter sp. EG35]|uniref:sarcosine oxidase subunit alpha family protein n=1 Tax=Lentilitoribacter sp. EG35 TaxID=3234192 RepID=UPI00345F1BE8